MLTGIGGEVDGQPGRDAGQIYGRMQPSPIAQPSAAGAGSPDEFRTSFVDIVSGKRAAEGSLVGGGDENAHAAFEEHVEVQGEFLRSLRGLASQQGAKRQQRFLGNQVEIVEVVIHASP